MRLVVSFGAATLLALGGGAAWAAPDRSSTVNIEVPVSGTVLNPCNGESVSWQGTAHFVVHQTVTSNGYETLSGHVNFQGLQGQGSLGMPIGFGTRRISSSPRVQVRRRAN